MTKTYELVHPTKTPDSSQDYLDHLWKLPIEHLREEAKRLRGALIMLEHIIDEGEGDQPGKLQNFVKVVLGRPELGPEYFNND